MMNVQTNQSTKAIIPQTIPAVAIGLFEPLFFATTPKIMEFDIFFKKTLTNRKINDILIHKLQLNGLCRKTESQSGFLPKE